MKNTIRAAFLFFLAFCAVHHLQAQAKRLVIIKVDGLSEDLLERDLDKLPWIKRVFVERGAWVRNFYVRGISLSAPSWSMLDTGQHMVIRGNAEFDRLTGHVYDYLNFFPFYFGYARSRRADMPGVEVLDEAGIPLLSDAFPANERIQGMQLYQRGVHWETLGGTLRSTVARPVKDLIDEWQTGFDMSAGIEMQQERELIAALQDPHIHYLDYFTGDVDHTAHLTNDPASQRSALRRVDATVGHVWSAIEASPLAASTVLALVSDHGMNSVPEVYSQGYNLVRFFNSPAGGGHHVVSTRHPLSEYKLRGLDPFVSSVITPSEDSFYLGDEKDWPTALLDLDGNERASIQLRNSDWNELQILSRQLGRSDLNPLQKSAVRDGIVRIIDTNRSGWSVTAAEIDQELGALRRVIAASQAVASAAKVEDHRRMAATEDWQKQERAYADYSSTLKHLLELKASDLQNARVQLPKGIPGPPNSLAQLENYAVGPPPEGIVFGQDGALDLNRSFAHRNYFQTLADIRVRNVVQPELGAKPVDFIAARSADAIYLYGDAQHGALIRSRFEGGELWLRYQPVCDFRFTPAEWSDGFPLHLFEDPELHVPVDRKAWLSEWHSESDWFEAIHRTKYSNGLIGLYEFFAPWRSDYVPAIFGATNETDGPLLRRFAIRLRRVTEPDILLLASDHWNFNVRGFNPGGNHGSFFRISTHSVFMAAGGPIPPAVRIERPYDSLSFAPTMLSLMGLATAGTYPGPIVTELTLGSIGK